MRVVAVLLLLTSTALAKDFTVSDQDQQAIQAICDVAATAQQLNRDVRAQIAGWCVGWEKRVQEAAKPEPPKVPPPGK